MLIVQSCQAIRHIFVYPVPKIANQKPNFKEKPEKNWEKMAKTTKKEIAGRTSCRQACCRAATKIFLKNTKIGSRESATIKEKEWEQRRDQEGENQLGDV